MLSTGTTPQVLEESADRSWRRIRSRVDGVRNRQRAKYLGTGLLAALAVFVAAFLGFSAADIVFKLAVGTRVFVLLSTVIAVAFSLFHFVYRPWRKLGNTIQSAREVEGVYPQLEQQLSTALEFGADKEKARKFASPLLVAALVNQAGERSEPLDFKRTIRWKQLACAFGIAFVLAALMALYAAKNSRLFAITWARFMKPTANIAAPTLTEIKNVYPGNDKAEIESSVEIKVQLDGKLPETATLSVLIGDEKESHWEDRPMDRAEDGLYKATLRRLLDTARYKIHAGDTESDEYRIKVYKKPEITEFALRIEHPAYTGKGIEALPPGTGDVRALRGSKIHVDVKSNVDLGRASIAFKSKRAEVPGSFESAEARKASIVFDVDKDDDYQVKIADADGNPGAGALFQIKALKDRYPTVRIKKPEKDLMVHKEQTVEVEISADDDIGVREIGIFHSLGMEEKQLMVRRLDPTPLHVDGKLVWELGQMDLKGGEVISYYAYAMDNDTVTAGGPKMSKSDIHFITVYDEEKYDNEKDPKKKDKKQQGTPPEIKQLDKLIDAQKKILKDDFAQARQHESLRDKEEADRAKAADGEKVAASKTNEGQAQLRARVEKLIDEVKKELEQAANPEAEAKPKEGDPQPGGEQHKPALGEKEMKHMEDAIVKMALAEAELKKPDTPAAVKPMNEALRHLSETRRLLLSDKEGDPRFKMAMNKNSKKNQKKDQEQQQQDQQQAKEQLTQMPPMMERQKELDRQLEELNEKKQQPPQGDPQSEERKQQEEQKRELQKKAEDAAEKLAKEAEDRARKLEDLADRNDDLKPAQDKMQQAADKAKQAQNELKQPNQPRSLENAKDQNRQAQQNSREAKRALEQALQKQTRQQLDNAQKQAEELANRQQDIAEKMQQAQNEQQKGQQKNEQNAEKKEGQPQSAKNEQQQNGEQKSGEKQSAQQQNGQQPQKGEQQSAQQQGGEPKKGEQQSAQQQGGESKKGEQTAQQQGQGGQPSAEQTMREQAAKQADVKNDLAALNETLKSLGDKAQEEGLGGANDIEQAKRQSNENSPANQAADKAAQAMSSGKQDEAAREAKNAEKALQQLAEKLQQAKQNTDAGDMKQMAAAMKKLQAAQKEQGDIGKDLADKDKHNAPDLPNRQDKVGDAARELADASTKLQTLRHQNLHDDAKNILEHAAKQADQAAQAMRERNDSTAKSAAEKTEQALNQAVADYERAAGKTMEEKAKEAKALANAAKENQEKANNAIKDVPDKPAGAKLDQPEAAKRDEAANKQDQAARDARKLDQALEGLKEMAKDANPAASQAAAEARDLTQKTELPKNMEKNAGDMKRFGTDKKPDDQTSAKTPTEAAKKGEDFIQTLNKVDKQIDDFAAEARNSQLERLKAMEEAARQAAETAKALEKNDPNAKPNDQKNSDQKNENQKNQQANNPQQNSQNQQANNQSNNPSQANKQGDPKDATKANDPTKPDPNRKTEAKNEQPQAQENSEAAKKLAEERKEQLKQQMEKLKLKLERLEPNAPERLKMKEAMGAMEQAAQKNENNSSKPEGPPQLGQKNMGGANFEHIRRNMDDIAQGALERQERLLKARPIKSDETEEAPRDYRVLVEKYYEALSKDNEEERK